MSVRITVQTSLYLYPAGHAKTEWQESALQARFLPQIITLYTCLKFSFSAVLLARPFSFCFRQACNAFSMVLDSSTQSTFRCRDSFGDNRFDFNRNAMPMGPSGKSREYQVCHFILTKVCYLIGLNLWTPSFACLHLPMVSTSLPHPADIRQLPYQPASFRLHPYNTTLPASLPSTLQFWLRHCQESTSSPDTPASRSA